jgi:hypothetical protein
MWARAILAVAGALAALVVARDAPNFPIVAAMIGIVLIAVVLLLLALRSNWRR